MTTLDKTLSIAHQLFDQYRTTISILTGLVIISWLYNKFRVNRLFFLSKHSMQGKTILVTGGASGMGYEIAKDLLQRDARVILADYNMKKGYQALKQLCVETSCNEKTIRLMECDLRSFESVRKFVKLYDKEEKRLDVLICNAGIAWAPDLITKDGFNTVIQVNYLSHFLLTNLLLEKLKQCRPSRIVYVASGSHRTNDVDVFAVNPSWVWTSLQSPMREAIGLIPFLICYPILYIRKFILAKTPKTGARTTIFCAVEPSLQRSRDLYFEDCTVETVSSLCTNDALSNQLWKLSSEAVGF